MEEEHETSSLWARHKKSSVSLTCCFNGHVSADSFDVMSSSSSSSLCPSPRISPSTWIRSKTNELHDINIKGRCKTLMSRVGRHRRHSSAEFSYDPVSYSLNFEDTDHHHHHPSEVEEFPMNFAARLPISPPPSAAGRIMLDMQPQMRTLTGHHEHPTTTNFMSRRAAVVTEVRKNLQPVVAHGPAAPTRHVHEGGKKHQVEEMRSTRSSNDVGHHRRCLNMPPTPRKVMIMTTTSATAAEARNWSYNTSITDTRRRSLVESKSPATSRQVLVEIC